MCPYAPQKLANWKGTCEIYDVEEMSDWPIECPAIYDTFYIYELGLHLS